MKNDLIKTIFLGLMLVVGMGMFSKFRKNGVYDIRVKTAVAHTCIANCNCGCNAYGGCLACPTPTPHGGCTIGSCCANGLYCINVSNNVNFCGGGVCGVIPTTAPTATSVPVAPTAVPCESNDNNVCNNGSSYCLNNCVSSGVTDPDTGLDTGGWAIVSCYTNENCYKANSNNYCNTSSPDKLYVGTVYCPGGNAVPTSYCHPFECYSAPNSTYCPGFGGSSCSGGAGKCDNCGGMSCGSCGGSAPTPTGVQPTINPSCSPDCSSDPCKNNLCSDETCLGACGGYCIGLLSCNAPTFTSLAIKNASGTAVSADTSNRNQICESTFHNDSEPRKVIYEASVADLDGYTDISNVKLRWNGNVYPMALSSGSGSKAIYTATIDYSAVNDSGTYPLKINVTDSKSKTTGWVTTNRNFKVWNCQIPVSGTIYVYDSSSDRSCNLAFINPISTTLNFSAITFSNTSGVGDVPSAVNNPNYGSANLIWGQTYLPLVNGGNISQIEGDLQATGRLTRIIDTGVGATSCPVATSFNLGNYVSAYATTPQAEVDLSYIRNQEGWFQVVGGGVKAKHEISSGVPFTMTESVRALSIAGTNADNGLVSFATFSNINGDNTETDYGRPNDWWTDQNTNDSTIYNYQYFYNNFYFKNGVGITGTDWDGKPSDGVYLVNGDLNIDSNFSLASGKFFMVVVKGKISIANTVSRLDGIYVSDGGIEALGTSDSQLVINGMLYSRSTIRLARSYTDKSLNNDSPAIKVNYNPELIFNMPGKLMDVLSGWNEQ
jgi:hypothetical protein